MKQCSAAMSKNDTQIIISVAFAAFLVSLDHYIVNICLPAIAQDLHADTSQVSRIVLVYFLVMASTLLVFGKIGDRIGFRSMFRLGYLVFGLGSFLCGISQSLNVLLFSRCIQGIGGSMLYTSCFAIIPRFLPKEIAGRTFGMLSTISALGILTGAPLGGFIAGYFHWQWVFLINIPLIIYADLVGMRSLPKEKRIEPGTEETFDIPGAILIFLGILALIVALNVVNKLGWQSPIVLLLFFGSAFFLTAFMVREHYARNPMVELAVFKNLDFSFTNLGTLTAIIFMAGSNFLIPFYLVDAKGISVELAGTVILIYSLTYMITSPLAGRAADHIHPYYLRLTGMFLAAGASAFFATFLQSPGLWVVMLFLDGSAYPTDFLCLPMQNIR